MNLRFMVRIRSGASILSATPNQKVSMIHKETEITEVVIVINETYCGKLNEAVEQLKPLGLEVFSTDEEEGIVTGSIETYKLPTLEKAVSVNYVRLVQTYIADFPVKEGADSSSVDEDENEAV